MAVLMPPGKQQYTDNNGAPLVGGKLYTYDAGTVVPRPTWKDAAQTVLNTNPIIFDARGEALVFWSGTYKIVLKTSTDVTLWTVDNVTDSTGAVDDLRDELADTADPTKGAGMVGYNPEIPYAPGTAGGKLRERISVSDYADLTFTHNAKDPLDPNSHVAVSFTSWRLAIQAAIDEAFDRGGATVVVDCGAAPFLHATMLVDDSIYVKAGVRLEFEATIKLGDYTSIGGVILMQGDDIEIVNPLLDGSNIFAGGTGENGINGYGGKNQKVWGGKVINFSRGTGIPQPFGGKAFQFEGGETTNITVDGTSIENCFIAMSSLLDFAEGPAIGPIHFTNMIVNDCEVLLFVRQSGGSDTTGSKHSVILDNFTASSVGFFEGVMQFSRAANVLVTNGLITTPIIIDSFIRGNHRFCEFSNLTLNGDCTQIINLDPGTYASDSSQALENNKYDFKHSGTTGYVANSSLATPFRTLDNSQIDFLINADVTSKITGDELRNGYCLVSGQQGIKSFVSSASDLTTRGLAKFASFPTGHSVITSNLPGYSFNPVSSHLSFTDASGAGLVFTVNNGDWTKIGRMVFMTFNITYPVTASGANALIGGLPFPASSGIPGGSCGVAIRYSDVTGVVYATVSSGASTMSFINAAPFTNAQLSGKSINGTLIYTADAP